MFFFCPSDILPVFCRCFIETDERIINQWMLQGSLRKGSSFFQVKDLNEIPTESPSSGWSIKPVTINYLSLPLIINLGKFGGLSCLWNWWNYRQMKFGTQTDQCLFSWTTGDILETVHSDIRKLIVYKDIICSLSNDVIINDLETWVVLEIVNWAIWIWKLCILYLGKYSHIIYL